MNNKVNVIGLSSAEFAYRVVKVQLPCSLKYKAHQKVDYYHCQFVRRKKEYFTACQ